MSRATYMYRLKSDSGYSSIQTGKILPDRHAVVCAALDGALIDNVNMLKAAPELLEALESAMKEDESAEFELWLDRVRPSGDAERVQWEWEQSSPFLDHSDKWAAAIAAIAKAKGDAK